MAGVADAVAGYNRLESVEVCWPDAGQAPPLTPKACERRLVIMPAWQRLVCYLSSTMRSMRRNEFSGAHSSWSPQVKALMYSPPMPSLRMRPTDGQRR